MKTITQISQLPKTILAWQGAITSKEAARKWGEKRAKEKDLKKYEIYWMKSKERAYLGVSETVE